MFPPFALNFITLFGGGAISASCSPALFEPLLESLAECESTAAFCHEVVVPVGRLPTRLVGVGSRVTEGLVLALL